MNIEHIEIIDFILKELYEKDENYGESLNRIESNFKKHNHGIVNRDLWNKIIRICENKYLLEASSNNGRYRIRPEGIEILLQHGSYLEYWKSENVENAENQEIKELKKKNLELQNKQLRLKILYSAIGFISAALVSNWKDILIMLQVIDKQ